MYSNAVSQSLHSHQPKAVSEMLTCNKWTVVMSSFFSHSSHALNNSQAEKAKINRIDENQINDGNMTPNCFIFILIKNLFVWISSPSKFSYNCWKNTCPDELLYMFKEMSSPICPIYNSAPETTRHQMVCQDNARIESWNNIVKD